MLLTLGAASLGYVSAAVLLDRYGRRTIAEAPFDAIIVLGCRVLADGRPSASLARRTDRAVELYHRGLAPTLIFTGGVGPGTPVSEAHAMARIARAQGVPDRDMMLEDRSTSTEENAREAAAQSEARRVLIVTDAYHVFRSERVFRRYFDHAVGTGSVGPTTARVRGALREVAALVGYGLRGRL